MSTSSSKSKVSGSGGSFASYELTKELLIGLNRMNYKAPTPVQRKALPIALSGMDMVCMARTGSGKTCVFLLPMLEKLKTHKIGGGVRGLVLSPTRELAVQTFSFAKSMAHFMDLRVASIVGGDGIEKQFHMLSQNPDVIVATPGRLMHQLREIKTFNLKKVEYLAFDEADRLFEMGFAEQLHEIIRQCPAERQTLLFSATMPRQLVHFARAGLRDPELIRLDTDVKMSEELRLGFFFTRTNEKLAAFMYLVRKIIKKGELTIVFTATRHHSEFLAMLLTKNSIESTLVYGNMDQEARNSNLNKFRSGKVQYLIVTDVAARGIDIPLLSNVVNYHFPASPKLFVHRCGRAARQGRVGYAYSLIDPEELAHSADCHSFLGHTIKCCADGSCGEEALAPYKLRDMQPDMVHTGCLPPDVLSEETGFIRELLAGDDDLKNMMQVCDNAMRLYKKTRSKPTPAGIRKAKVLVKANEPRLIHPLIVGEDPGRCDAGVVSKAAFIRQLQTFRPSQTILESGIGAGAAAAKSSRARGKKGKVDAGGVKVMQALRKEMKASLTRTRDAAATAAVAGLQGGDGDDDDDDDDDDGGGGGMVDEAESAAAVDWAELVSGADDEFTDPPSGAPDARVPPPPPPPPPPQHASLSSSSTSVHVDMPLPPDAPPASGAGLSRAAQKRAKKRRREQRGSEGSSGSADGPGASAAVLTHGSSSSSSSSSAAATQGLTPAAMVLARERAMHYMAYGNEELESGVAGVQDELLAPNAGLSGGAMQSAQRMEAAMLDLTSDDAVGIAKRKKTRRWDEKKMRFVFQTDAEAAEAKSSGGKHQVSRDGRSTKAVGEMYKQWMKKTKKEVGGDHAEEMDRPSPNVRVNKHVKDELKTSGEIKKVKATKAKNIERNMEKGKRQKLRRDRRKAQEEANSKRIKLTTSRKSRAYIR